jgi:hypothetical protein
VNGWPQAGRVFHASCVQVPDLHHGGGAQVEIVPRPGLADTVIGGLHDAAEVLTHAAGQEQADLVERDVVVGREAVGQRRRRLGLGMEIGSHGHDRKRHGERPSLRPFGIAVQLEVTTVGRELRAEAADVTGLAGMIGLNGERGDGQGGSGSQAAESEGQERGDAGPAHPTQDRRQVLRNGHHFFS